MVVPSGTLPGGAGNNGYIWQNISGSCSNGVCQAAENFGNTLGYTVPASTWRDALAYWPGGFVLTSQKENEGWQYGARLYTDVLPVNGTPFISSIAPIVPTVYAQDCSGGPTIGSPIWFSCLAADPVGGDSQNNGPMVLQNGVPNVGFTLYPRPMGRIVLEGTGPAQQQDFITFGDSVNGATLFSQPGLRPSAQLADCAIAGDGNGTTGYGGLALRCANTVSSYIDHLPDGANWLEQLAANAKKFTVPLVLSNGPQTPTNPTYTLSPITPAASRTLSIADPGGSATLGLSLGSTTITFPAMTAVNAGSCNTAYTGTISSVSTFNALIVTPQSSLSTAGFKGMAVDAYVSNPTAGTVTLEVCNAGASSTTTAFAVVFNLKVF